MAKRRLRIVKGAAKEIGWMFLGILTLAVTFAIVLGFVNFARNESTSSHVAEVQRSVVKVSVCAEHPHSKLCLKGITRAVRTCLEDPTCHALLATGIRGPMTESQAFHGLSHALLPALSESGGIVGLTSPVPVKKPPGGSKQQHVGKTPPAQLEPLPNTPVVPATQAPTPHPPEEQPVTRTPGPQSQTIEPPEAVLPVLPSEGAQKCHISVLGVQICVAIGE